MLPAACLGGGWLGPATALLRCVRRRQTASWGLHRFPRPPATQALPSLPSSPTPASAPGGPLQRLRANSSLQLLSAFPSWLTVLSIFSCAFRLFVPLWRNVCSDLRLVFYGVIFPLLSCRSYLCALNATSLSVHDLQAFSPNCRPPFQFPDGRPSYLKALKISIKFNLPLFSLIVVFLVSWLLLYINFLW